MDHQNTDAAWLKQLVGTWRFTFETTSDSEAPGYTITGTETIWPVGDFFVAVENRGVDSKGSASHAVISLGYDPERARFIGAHAGSAVSALFVYEGTLDASGTALNLETEGPAMTEGKTIDHYRDVLRIVDADTREQSLQVLDTKGEWKEFARYQFARSTS